MKKLICLLLCLSMLLALSACGGKNEVPAATEPVADTRPAADEGTSAFDLATFDHSQYGYLRSNYSLPDVADNPSRYSLDGDVFSFCNIASGTDGETRTYTLYTAVGGQQPTETAQLTTPVDGYFSDLLWDGEFIWTVYSYDMEVDPQTFSDNIYGSNYITVITLQKRDASGEIVAEFNLGDLFTDAEFYYTSSVIPDGGGLWVTCASFTANECIGSILYFDSDLKLKYSLDDFDDAPSIAKTADGEIVCIYDGRLSVVDQTGFAPTDIQLENDSFWYTLVSGSGGYDMFIYDDSTLYACDIEAGLMVPLLNWTDWGVTNPSFVGALSETQLLVRYSSIYSGEAKLVLMDRVDISQIPEKTVITIGYLEDIEYDTQDAAAVFNGESSKYRIELVVYDDESALDMAFARGEGPDMLVLYENQSKYIKKGLLADMLPLMDQYGGITRDDLVTSFVDASMTGDSLYMMAWSFSLRTMIGLPEYVGSDQGWSYEQFISALENMPDGMYACDFGGTGFLEFLLGGLYTEYVDTESGTCDFDSVGFITLLDALAKYVNFDSVEPTEYYDDEIQYLTEKVQLLDVTNIFSSYYLRGQFDQVTMVGYPGGVGNGADFNISNTIGICSGCKDMEGAWEFVSFMLSDEVQSSFGSLIYPVNRNALESALSIRAESYEENYPGAGQRAEALMDYIDAVETISYREHALFDIIAEEAEALFAGSKSAEETAKIIQNRVSTYLAEMG